MKVKTSYSNEPIWRRAHTHVQLPNELLPLEEVAGNIWWSWNDEAQNLFQEIDPKLWNKTDHNPVALLQRLSHERAAEVIADDKLMAKVEVVCKSFKEYMSVPFNKKKPSVAYFSMEYGFTHVLKIYSGGLGVLAGDYLKEASDSQVDLTGVGFLYRYGYFSQTISPDGQQIANPDAQAFNEIPVHQVMNEDGNPMVLAVPFPERSVYANVWVVKVGRISLYLLDTDNEMNSEFDRVITHQLYGGDWENRIKQEVLLGIGGILLLNKLGIKKDIYHCNEGHAAFINVQRLLDLIEGEGLTFNQALEVVRSSGLYTVHTPVPAGHDYFDEGLLGKYMSSYPARLGITWQEFVDMGRENPGSHDKFSMSAFALNTCQEANGVSYLHGIVSRQMFQPMWKSYFPEELHVGYVTNGVHMPTWTTKEMKDIYEKYFDKSFYDDESNMDIWEAIQRVPDKELWETRLALKKRLVKYIKEHMTVGLIKSQRSPSDVINFATQINPDALLVGFARRFATYKRAHLLFTDLDRLSKLVNNKERPIQFIFAGKAHPADGGGQGLIKHIIEVSRRPEFAGKIIFLENYNMELAKHLVSGVDIWLNTPTRPLEASGTSGMKAVMNGVLNFSVLDGWWYEGYKENAGWMLTDKRTYDNQGYQDELDAVTIYHTFETEILPAYYARNTKGYSPEWMQYVKNTIAEVAPNFTMKRMIDDYIDRFYDKQAKRHKLLSENNYEIAKVIASYKEDTAEKWDHIEVISANIGDVNALDNMSGQINSLEGDLIISEVVVDKKDLKTDLGVDIVATQFDPETHENKFLTSVQFKLVKQEGSKLYFRGEWKTANSGIINYGIRIFPVSEYMPHRMDLAYVRWV